LSFFEREAQVAPARRLRPARPTFGRHTRNEPDALGEVVKRKMRRASRCAALALVVAANQAPYLAGTRGIIGSEHRIMSFDLGGDGVLGIARLS
jgi:hypothetical protein